MDVFQEYKTKLRSAEEAVRVVQSGDWVDYTQDCNQPILLDRALAARKEELHDIKVRGSLAYYPRMICEQDPEEETFTYMSWHFSGIDRQEGYRHNCHVQPMVFRNLPSYYRKGHIPVDVAMLSVAPMDQHGYFSFSLNSTGVAAVLEEAKIVIVEVNDNLPRVFGGRDNCVHIANVDYIVEVGRQFPLKTVATAPFSDIDRQVASYIVSDIQNGSILQLGIGGMPYRVGFIFLVAIGAFLKLEAIWVLADIVNGLMAIPNLIALLGLSGVVVAETKAYYTHLKEEKATTPEGDLRESPTTGH